MEELSHPSVLRSEPLAAAGLAPERARVLVKTCWVACGEGLDGHGDDKLIDCGRKFWAGLSVHYSAPFFRITFIVVESTGVAGHCGGQGDISLGPSASAPA